MTLAHDQDALERFESVDPASGEVLATWPVDDEVSVREVVDRARLAAQWWADLGYADRRERLLAWTGVVTRRVRQLAQLVHRENGKPVDDAILEILLTVDDPRGYTQPWTVTIEERLIVDTELIDEVCLENERSLQHMK